MNSLPEFRSSTVSRWFKQDYAEARQLFVDCSNRIEQEIPQQNWFLPNHPNLSVDRHWFGNTDADSVLVMLSATHGVEGYCGSAAQSFLLHLLHHNLLKIPASSALLMVHSLNPWGMHWARRCNEQGIDLNRNFIDFDNLPPANCRYDALIETLILESAAQRRQRLAELAIEIGQQQLDLLISEGQYHCDWAPFYGGTSPCFSNQIVDELIGHWQLEGRNLIVIDLHSGLGPWAFGELISDHPVGSSGANFARNVFGPAVVHTATGESCSVPKLGLLDYRWHKLMLQQGCYLTLEFGSYSTAELFEVLINEHLFWRNCPYPDKEDTVYLQHRHAMLQHFCPDDTLWQQAVLFKTWQVVERAFKGGA